MVDSEGGFTALRESIEKLAKLSGFKHISDDEVNQLIKDFPDSRLAYSAIAHAMWVDAHPGWRKRSPAGYIYFLFSDLAGAVKIGFSTSPESRVKAIRGMSPVPVRLLGQFPGTLEDEKSLHVRFGDFRLHGEWFRVDGELARYIEERF